MSKKPKLVDAADASVKAMDRVKAAVGAVGRALGKTSRPPPKSSSRPAPADPTVDDGAKTARVRFEVQASTDYGQMVCVVGDHAALGAWDPARALPLDASQYPTWSGRVEVGRGQRIEYKYVRRQSDGSCAWEAQTDNRVLTVPASGAEVSTRDEANWTD
jgi:alpha-amylase